MYLQAGRALGQIRAWLDLITVLNNLGASQDAGAPSFIAQALWLGLRVQAPVEHNIALAGAFVSKLGPRHDLSPYVASFAAFTVETRAEAHPKREKLRQAAMSILAACAQARQVPLEQSKFQEWVQAEGLNDPNRFVPTLNRGLEVLIGETWLFDRGLLPALSI